MDPTAPFFVRPLQNRLDRHIATALPCRQRSFTLPNSSLVQDGDGRLSPPPVSVKNQLRAVALLARNEHTGYSRESATTALPAPSRQLDHAAKPCTSERREDLVKKRTTSLKVWKTDVRSILCSGRSALNFDTEGIQRAQKRRKSCRCLGKH